MIRPFACLIPVYAAALGAKNMAYERGWAQSEKLTWPVISVGNLSVGGAGKTPLVIRLAELLKAGGIAVDVLSRGYGRSGTTVERVNAEGDAVRYGDEPLLIARAAKIPVYVGVKRYDAGLLAEREAVGQGIHLLDDGFQHRRLARDMDIVILHSSDFEESLLPAGRLRERLGSLKRASAIVLRAEDRALEDELRKRGITAPVWIQHRKLLVEPASRAIAFCGIARPEEFFAVLRANGTDIAATVVLRDHQAYSHAEIERIISILRQHKAECFVTTEKDAVRMSRENQKKLETIAPLRVARLAVSLEDENMITRQMLNLLVRK